MSKANNSLASLALQKFKRNFWGVFSFWFIVFVGLLSIFAYVLAPDNSQYANQMNLSIHSKKPGFEVDVILMPIDNVKQNTFNKLFFGDKNNPVQIPISEYSINEEQLNYTEYASDGLVGITKSISLNIFKSYNPKEFIVTKTFWFGTRKFGSCKTCRTRFYGRSQEYIRW